MPSTTRRAPAADSWLAAYQAEMEPWFQRADAAVAFARTEVARSRGFRGWTSDGSCLWCNDGSGRHAVWCMDANAPRSAAS